MAWQLIYTSAPRLLEAGRTGFGTVARHRAVSGMLASTVERFSQFARLPGHDPRRVVHTYRTVTTGSSTYHVFSCLRDAGSDYSGRTNHLAHHLIAEAREIRALAGSGLTAADVLLGMSWLSVWAEPPRFLDPTEEIALGSLPVVPSKAWATLTGSSDSARLLSAPTALKGAYLILPPGLSALELFRESLLETPQSGWQTSFTTCLEPNDEVGDFRWIGIPADSPLRAQAETSSRALFDLTQPAQLPIPPVPVAPEPEPIVQPEPVTLPATSQATPAPSKVTLRQEGAASQTPAPNMGSMGGWDVQRHKKAGSKKSNLTLVYSLSLVAVIILSIAGYVVWMGQKEAQTKAAFVTSVDQTWSKFLMPGQLENTRNKISGQENFGEGQQMLKSYKNYFEALTNALKRPNASQQISLPDDAGHEIDELQQAFNDWQGADAKLMADWQALTDPSTPLQPGLLAQKYQEWLKRRGAAWDALAARLNLKGTQSPRVEPAFRAVLLEPLRQHVHDKAVDIQELPDLEKLSKLLGPDPDLTQWMTLLSGLEGNDKSLAADNVLKDNTLPQWLREKARKLQTMLVKSASRADPMDETKFKTSPNPNPTKQIEPQKEDADSYEAKNAIFICLPKVGEDLLSLLQKISLPKAPNMEIYVGTAVEKHPPPGTSDDSPPGTLKHWRKIPLADENEMVFGESIMATASSSLKFSAQGQISQVPSSSTLATQGLRIVARSQDKHTVLYDLRILPSSGGTSAKLFAAPLKITSISAETGMLPYLGNFIKRLNFVGATTVSYKLRSLDANQSPYDIRPLNADHYEVIFAPPVTNDVSKKIEEKKRQIAELEAGKKSIETQKSSTKSSLAGYIDKMDKWNSDIATKDQEIATLNSEITELQKPADLPRMNMDPGEYILLALAGADTVIEVSRILFSINKSNL